MATRFVLLSTQRSGSTWVIDMLNSHPRLTVYGELFTEDGQGKPRWGAQDMFFWETYRANNKTREDGLELEESELISQYLDQVYSPRAGIVAVGFKLMYGQAKAYPQLIRYMLSNGLSVIHLIRQNFLDIILSSNAAVFRGVFAARASDAVPNVKLRLSIARLLDRLTDQERQVERARERFSRLGLPYLEVYYEELVSAQTPFSVLSRFLGVESGEYKLESPLRKLNTQSHRELIENYDSIRKGLEGTRFFNLLR